MLQDKARWLACRVFARCRNYPFERTFSKANTLKKKTNDVHKHDGVFQKAPQQVCGGHFCRCIQMRCYIEKHSSFSNWSFYLFDRPDHNGPNEKKTRSRKSRQMFTSAFKISLAHNYNVMSAPRCAMAHRKFHSQ